MLRKAKEQQAFCTRCGIDCGSVVALTWINSEGSIVVGAITATVGVDIDCTEN